MTSDEEVGMVSVQMWALAVDQAMIADYSTFERAEVAGFHPDALVGEDYARCQQEGARLRLLDYGGILAPSAALPGAVNVTLFGPRTASTWNRPPLLASSVPATIIAKGAPPPGLLHQVRQLGDTHPGLAEYRRARSVGPDAGDAAGD